MITEDYISFETAKLLKEKGFNEECNSAYCFVRRDSEDKGEWDVYYNPMLFSDVSIMRPTLQMAMKWLREVHNLDIIAPPQFDNTKWTYSAIIFKLSIPCMEIRLNDNKDKKEAAYEAAIRHCLENLI